jgi:phenylalanyl-tRNA synthetase alpha subunit
MDMAEAQRVEAIDVSLPGRPVPLGTLHPITQIIREICAIFQKLGFDIAEGPEVESDYYNFEALNIPKIILPGICKILSMYPKILFCGLILHRFRSA